MTSLKVSITPQFLLRYDEITLPWLSCTLKIETSPSPLLEQIRQICKKIRDEKAIDDIPNIPSIHHTRKAYRALGKEPARYRPSAEALTRRIVKGKDLYLINNAIDIVNLISLSSGVSIGAFDMRFISGSVEMDIGKAKEPYEAIGRGNFNIENLPVLRDSISAFGSPTSDSMRTRVREDTTEFLMVFCNFGTLNISNYIRESTRLLKKFAGAEHFCYGP
jgi:DNA/RNA-binding domain of Phe-tRNA-synthetase-like protein